MMEWATYSVGDFLPYDRDAAYRLFEIANARLWPLHLLLAVLAGILGFGTWARSRRSRRMGLLALAVAWATVSGGYLATELSSLLWLGPNLTWAAASFGALVLVIAVFPQPDAPPEPGPVPVSLPGAGPIPGSARIAALVLLAWALIGHPLTGPLLAGRSWSGMEWFGIAPGPTAIATLAIALVCRAPAAFALSAAPLVWAVLAAASAWALGERDTGVSLVMTAAIAMVGVGFRVRTWRLRRASDWRGSPGPDRG